MSTVTPLQSSFNGGALSPRVHHRPELAIRSIGVEKMLGWLPLLQGSAEACPGTIRVAGARAPVMRLIPYIFNETQAYIVEITDGKMRFYTNDARIETEPGVAYEIDAPWSADQLSEIMFEQSLDALYLYHGAVQTRKLQRTSATTFALNLVEFTGGPFLPRNKSKALTVTASSTEGTNVVLTASAPLFAATDIGRLFRMEAVDLGSIPAWDVGMSITAGQLRQSNGAIYQAVSTGKTGGVAPIHTEGVEWDGMGTADANSQVYGVQWAYLHDRFGLLRITEFTSNVSVKATVLRRLPYSVSTSVNYSSVYNPVLGGIYHFPTEFDPNDYEWEPPTEGGAVAGTPATWRWQFGAFSDTSGWPQCGVIFEERHCVGHWSTVHGSVIDDLEDYSPLNELGDPSRDMAFRHTLPSAAFIRWMAIDDQLLIGTSQAEWTLGPSSATQGIGPGATKATPQSGYGAAKAMPVMTDGRVLFPQRARRKVHEYAYRLDRNRFETPDLMRHADQIGSRKFVELAYQTEPGRLLWGVLADGGLAAALYEPKEEALGWATRDLPTDWAAVSICTIPDPAGEFDTLYIGAADHNGDGQVLRMQRIRDVTDANRMRVMTDASWIHDGAATGAISIPWLAGKTVDAVADNIAYLGIVLDGAGNGVLPGGKTATQIIAGLPFAAELDLLPFEAGGDNGPALMKLGKINRVAMVVVNGDAMEFAVQGVVEPFEIDDQPVMDVASPLRSGFFWCQAPGSWDRHRKISIRRTLPVPTTLCGVMAETDMQSHGGRP